MESRPTQAVLPLVGLAAEKILRDWYMSRELNDSVVGLLQIQRTQPSRRSWFTRVDQCSA
ncbi:MAG: hypothetical protein R6U98_20170 [Pirellulaceae bacterium]